MQLSYVEGMERLVLVVQQLATARTLEAVMVIVRSAARELSGADGATFVLRDDDHCHYADEEAIGPLWKGKRFPLHTCISGWAMLHREPVVIANIYADPRIPHDAYRPTFVKSLAMTPIRRIDPVGAIGTYWATQYTPTPEQLRLLQGLADAVSVALENVDLLANLERRVEERTAQLQMINDELESFSSAVSHDLRAPLRAIDAFTAQLAEDHGEALGSVGLAVLKRVHGATSRMQALVEDLLALSKASRGVLARDQVDLAALAREILGELQRADPQREVQVVIAPDLRVDGDPRLLRAVLDNLLGNAWKFTRKRPRGRIEVGHGADDCVFVRDNGAGFDPTYQDKLFRPFQRLHSSTEFEGTGIGLATVHRIIHRHGGRIWAESAPGEGATFSFTLDG
ncbi:MAG: histidine kinase [Myxococcales bacterium]|nr:histidine kinase [Myxococcales bacterium]